MAFYLLNPTSLNDTFYVSYSQNVPTRKRTKRLYQNYSIYYSVPWDYWSLDFFYSQSKTRQSIQAYWFAWEYKNKYRYRSVQLSRLLSYDARQRTSIDFQLFDNQSEATIEDARLDLQQKRSSGWKATLNNNLNYLQNTLNTTLSYQQKTHWFGTMPDEKIGFVSKKGRILTLDIDTSIQFSAWQEMLAYAPKFKFQLTPDKLSTLDKLSLGNRWTVRGFDGQENLIRDKGWFMQNELRWSLPQISLQPYISLDIGQTMGRNEQSYSGNTLIGSVIGARGWRWNTGYEFFAGTPVHKPKDLITDNLTLGFNLQWQY